MYLSIYHLYIHLHHLSIGHDFVLIPRIPIQHHKVYLAVPRSALVNPVRNLAPTVLNEYLFAQLLP